MKTWILTVKYGSEILEDFVCYCDEDPVKLLLSNRGYTDTLLTLQDDLYWKYNYLQEEPFIDEDSDDWTSAEYEDELYANFCECLNFESYKIDPSEGYSILIDERIDEI